MHSLAYLEGYQSIQSSESRRYDSFDVTPKHDVVVNLRDGFISVIFAEVAPESLLQSLRRLQGQVEVLGRFAVPDIGYGHDELRTHKEISFNPSPVYDLNEVASSIADGLEKDWGLRVQRMQIPKVRDKYTSRPTQNFRKDAVWRRDFNVTPTHDAVIICRSSRLELHFAQSPGDDLLRSLNELYTRVSRYADPAEYLEQVLPDGTTSKLMQPAEPRYKPGKRQFMLSVRPTYSPGEVAEAIAQHLTKRHEMKVLRQQEVKRPQSLKATKKFRVDTSGEGVPCGASYITPAYRCSKAKAKSTPKKRLKRLTQQRRSAQSASKRSTLEKDRQIASMSERDFLEGRDPNSPVGQKLRATRNQAIARVKGR